jgi:hypothetical protein
VLSNGYEHSALGVRKGMPVARIKHAARLGTLRVVSAGRGRSFVYGIRHGRVRTVGVTTLRGNALLKAVRRVGA